MRIILITYMKLNIWYSANISKEWYEVGRTVTLLIFIGVHLSFFALVCRYPHLSDLCTAHLLSDHCPPIWRTTTAQIMSYSSKLDMTTADYCTQVWKNQLYECLRKNNISILKINIFSKFNVQQHTGCLWVPLIFEFKIKKFF